MKGGLARLLLIGALAAGTAGLGGCKSNDMQQKQPDPVTHTIPKAQKQPNLPQFVKNAMREASDANGMGRNEMKLPTLKARRHSRLLETIDYGKQAIKNSPKLYNTTKSVVHLSLGDLYSDHAIEVQTRLALPIYQHALKHYKLAEESAKNDHLRDLAQGKKNVVAGIISFKERLDKIAQIAGKDARKGMVTRYKEYAQMRTSVTEFRKSLRNTDFADNALHLQYMVDKAEIDNIKANEKVLKNPIEVDRNTIFQNGRHMLKYKILKAARAFPDSRDRIGDMFMTLGHSFRDEMHEWKEIYAPLKGLYKQRYDTLFKRAQQSYLAAKGYGGSSMTPIVQDAMKKLRADHAHK